jgi:predicted porin
MNKNIKLAVAGAVLALSASANAGIIIPAGEWTLDINGNVNAFAIWNKADHTNTITGGTATTKDAAGEKNTQGINTGLLPSWLGFTGKTRQNDLDVEFTISFQPGVSSNHPHGDEISGATAGNASSNILNRQTYVSFGDKSWGSIKLGKDLGIYAADAILNDMTLLGVGGVANSGGTAFSGSGALTTIGGIGTGYHYAAWKGQIAYTTPNFNGFQATVGITNPNQGLANSGVSGATNNLYQDRHGLEGKASYSFSADALTGKVWVSGASYKTKLGDGAQATTYESTSTAADIGANVNFGGFGLTGYYYTGDGVGTTALFVQSHDTAGRKRDSDGGYMQATYILPTKTKIGLAYGKSNLDLTSAEAQNSIVVAHNKRMTVGAYHPLTKHLNLVAEYNDVESEAHSGIKNENSTISTGAILFF